MLYLQMKVYYFFFKLRKWLLHLCVPRAKGKEKGGNKGLCRSQCFDCCFCDQHA